MIYEFATFSGRIRINYDECLECESKACIRSCPVEILDLKNSVPVLAISFEEAEHGGCVECLACVQECYYEGRAGLEIDLKIPGLHEWKVAHS